MLWGQALVSLATLNLGSRGAQRVTIVQSLSGNDDYRSIGDVTLGLHGGKYQFDPTYSAGAASMFAPSPIRARKYSMVDEEPLPDWPVRWPSDGEAVLGLLTQEAPAAEVRNEEISWEPYFAIVVGQSAHLFVASPRRGHLAPRGGAANACDESKRYSDAQRFVVSRRRQPAERADCLVAGGAAPFDATPGATYLIVRTECDQWTWEMDFREVLII